MGSFSEFDHDVVRFTIPDRRWGAAWADGAGATGTARLGPRGLVQLLQTRLGLTRPAVEPAVRTAPRNSTSLGS